MNIYSPASRATPPAVTDAMMEATLPAMLMQRAARHAGRVIIRKKDRGIWTQTSWADLAVRARHVGMALVASGFAPGDRAGVLADTGPDWAYADLGVLGAGGVSVGLHPDSAAEQVGDVLRDCGATILFVQNEEQLDKALEARAACPDLRLIVVFEMTGLRELGDAMCESFAAFLARGAAHDAAHPDAWQAGIAAIRYDDLAVLIYTCGTDGAPHGAMLSHRTIMFQIVNGAAVMDQRADDERLAVLAMCHAAERITGLYQALYCGTITNYAEDTDTVLENLREIQPTIQGGVPGFWQGFHTRITLAVADATRLQRLAYRWAIGVGQHRADARLAGRRPSRFLAARYWLARRLVLNNIRRAIGMDRLRWGFVAAGPTERGLIRWYLALGVDLLETYGTTACGGLASWTAPGDIREDAAGQPVPYGEMAITADGEIVMRGEHVFQGYWNRPDRTAAVLRGGWLHTGDHGAIQDGILRVSGRRPETLYGDA